MASLDLDDGIFSEDVPVLYVLSDSRGETANAVVEAAAAQFSEGAVEIVRIPNVSNVEEVRDYFEANYDPKRAGAVFHTFASSILRREIRRELDRRGIPSIDLLGPAVNVVTHLTGEEPSRAIGATYDSKTTLA